MARWGFLHILNKIFDSTNSALKASITGSTVAHDAADSENPIKIGGKASAAAPAAVNEGDRVNASFDLEGKLRTATTVTTSIGEIAGDVAHDAVDSGKPVKVGFKAVSALPSAVAANDRADAISDLYGRQRANAVRDTDTVTLHNAVAIRDTANNDASITDTELLVGEKVIYVTNTLDQALNVEIFMAATNLSGASVYAETAKVSATSGVLFFTSASLATGSTQAVAVPALAVPCGRLVFRLKAGTNPTSGAVTAIMRVRK